jgi:hypothetical protein
MSVAAVYFFVRSRAAVLGRERRVEGEVNRLSADLLQTRHQLL